MTKHTPTPWFTKEGSSFICCIWNSMSCAVLRSIGARLEWHENLQKSNEESWENLKRAAACANAFHSPDGREIKTEKIEEGLFWEMRDLLESVPKALASAESAGEFEGSASVQYEDGLAPNRQAEKARRYSVDFAEKARALLAKLEE